MASKTPKPEYTPLPYVQADAVASQINKGDAYLGVIVSSQVDGVNNPFLIVSNNQGEIVSVHNMSHGNSVTVDKPMMIFGDNRPAYYDKGRSYQLVNGETDVTTNKYYDAQFVNNGTTKMSAYERAQALEHAMSLLDSDMKKHPENLTDYLNGALKTYSSQTHTMQVQAQTGDSWADVERQQARVAMMRGDDSTYTQALVATVAASASVRAGENLQQTIKDANQSFSNFEREVAKVNIETATMTVGYHQASKALHSGFADELKRDGLLGYVGNENAVSLSKIESVLHKQKDEYQLLASTNGASDSYLSKKLDYIHALGAVHESHPALINERSIQNNKQYVMPPNSDLLIDHQHRLANGNIVEGLQSASKVYGNMSQNGFYDYMVQRSLAIQIIYGQMDGRQIGTGGIQGFTDAVNAGGDGQTLNDKIGAARDYITSVIESERLSQKLKNNGHSYDPVMLDRFLNSAEFASIVNEPKIITIDSTPRLHADGTVTGGDALKLKPEYAVDWTRSIATADGAEAFKQSIDSAIASNERTHNQHSHMLAASKEFIEDYIKYNAYVANGTYNHIIASGLDQPRMEYSAETLTFINGTHTGALNALVHKLQSNGYEIDFSGPPNLEQSYKNYYALSDGIDKLNEAQLNEFLASLKHSEQLASTDVLMKKIQLHLDDLMKEENEQKKMEDFARYLDLEYDKMSANERARYKDLFNDEVVAILEQMEYSSRLSTFKDSLAKDISDAEVSYLRGCENFIKNFGGAAIEGDIQAARLFDFATVMSEGTYTREQQKALAFEVLNNLEVRDNMIDELNANLKNKKSAFDKIDSVYDLVMNEPAQDAPDSVKRERLMRIGEAFGWDMTKDTEIKLKIMETEEFKQEMRKIVMDIRNEHYNLQDTPYHSSLQKSEGIKELRTILQHENELSVNIDYSLYGGGGYMAFLRSKLSDTASADTIKAFNDLERYSAPRVEATLKNVESLVHSADLSSAERQHIREMASTVLLEEAAKAGKNVNVMGDIYRERLDQAMDAKHHSVAMQKRVDDYQDTLSANANILRNYVDTVNDKSSKIDKTVRLQLQDGAERQMDGIQKIIADGSDLNSLMSGIEKNIKENRYYAGFYNNDYSSKFVELESVRKQIYHAEALRDSHQAIHKGRHSLGFEMQYQKNDQHYADTIRDLKQREQQLESAILNGHGGPSRHIHAAIEPSHRAWSTTHNQDTAVSFVKDVIEIYGKDTHFRTQATRLEELSGYSTNKLLEVVRDVDPPAVIKKDYFAASAKIADEVANDCLNKLKAAHPELALTHENLDQHIVALSKTKGFSSIYHTYTEAMEVKREMNENVQEITRLQEGLRSYAALNDIVNTTSSMSGSLRKELAEAVYGNESVVSRDKVIDGVSKMTNANERTIEFEEAYQELYKKLDNGQYVVDRLFKAIDSDTFKSNDSTHIEALAIIERYNKAVNGLTAEDREAITKAIVESTQALDNDFNRRAIQGFALTPVQGHDVADYINAHQEEIKALKESERVIGLKEVYDRLDDKTKEGAGNWRYGDYNGDNPPQIISDFLIACQDEDVQRKVAVMAAAENGLSNYGVAGAISVTAFNTFKEDLAMLKKEEPEAYAECAKKILLLNHENDVKALNEVEEAAEKAANKDLEHNT